MKETREKTKITEKILQILVIYTIGIVGWLLFKLLLLFKRIKVVSYQEEPFQFQNGLLVVSNHPSLLEPILIPFLFFRFVFWHPIKFCPINTPDKKNYYDKCFWFWIRGFSIPVDRKSRWGRSRSLVKIKNALSKGKIVIFFPEGGRTEKGKEFVFSKKGKKIRLLEKGIGWLISKTKAQVLPLWVEGTEGILPNSPNPEELYSTFPRFWKRAIIKIGNPLKFSGDEDKEKIVKEITSSLLQLADKEE